MLKLKWKIINMKKEYKKCDNYPACTYVECECHFNFLLEQHLNTPSEKVKEVKEITGFKVVDGKAVPVFKK